MSVNNNTKAEKNTGLNYLDYSTIAAMKRVFPQTRTAKNGDSFYPVIDSKRLMDYIADDNNMVPAIRTVKANANNPGGSEHGVVKKVCDLLLDNPSFRNTICEGLKHGYYCPERIASDPVFVANRMVLPRGLNNTVNQIVQTMIMRGVQASNVSAGVMPCAWSEMNDPGLSEMIEVIDSIRGKGYTHWISFRLRDVCANVPRKRLTKEIHNMFRDGRVAETICTLLEQSVKSNSNKKAKSVGIPKDSPLANLLAYDLYMNLLDQKIMRMGLTHVRYNEEVVVFCESYEVAEKALRTLINFAKNSLGCPISRRYTKIKDMAHLAFRGLRLWGGNWRLQYKVKNAVASDFIISMLAYGRFQEEHYLWSAYSLMTKFISRYEGVYALKKEIERLKKWRDSYVTYGVAFVEKVKLGLIKLAE